MAALPESRYQTLVKNAGRWAKDHRSGTFAGLTFAVSVSLALFFGLSNLGEPDPKLTYEILRETDVLDVRTPVEDLQITFQNEDIQGENLNLRIYAMRVINNGEVDILQTQFDQDQVWGLQVIDGRVIEARPIEASSSYLNEKSNPQVRGENIVEFGKAIVEKGQFFAFNMLVVHSKDVTPEIVSLGKIAGIDEIVVTRVPVKVEGPGFLSDLFAGGWAVQLVRAILFLMGAAVILGLFAAAVLFYGYLTAAIRRRRIGNSVVMKTMSSQKQRDLLSEVYLHHGMAGVSDLREKLGSSQRLEQEASTQGMVVLAGESEFRIPPAYYSAASLAEAEALSRKGKKGFAANPEFQERLELFLQELSTSRRIF
ncbi:MAG: hypothetical protein J4O10_05755 [Chloroflexi bacterium]|nr:hypothetical protein [Chloroflexota bacterium]